MSEFDRDHHVSNHSIEQLLAVEFAKVARRRAGIVIDQDVWLGAGGEQGLLALGQSDIGGHRDHFAAGCLFQFGGGGSELCLIAAVDHHFAAGLRQRLGAGIA